MEFGQILKNIRIEKGMSQVALAEFLDVSECTVCNWEKGKYPPSKAGIEILKEKLGINFTRLPNKTHNFYHLKARLKKYPAKDIKSIYGMKQVEKELEMLKWSIAIGNTQNEQLYLGTIAMILMQHCFKNGFEFEACLAMAIDELNKEAK